MWDGILSRTELNKHTVLFVIGNGFDLAHGLPTRFDPDFKKIAIGNESNSLFWDLYQSESADIWSDFERLLAKPDFNTLREIFVGYVPDYMSDHESDRDSIITQADISGNLNKSLIEFALNAEKSLPSIQQIEYYRRLISSESYYLSFNYTSTLENVYHISPEKILHIHGKVNEKSDLILGYDVSEFDSGTVSEEFPGTDQYTVLKTAEYIESIEDYYIRTAFANLLRKTQSWAKPLQKTKLQDFLGGVAVDEVVVIGFSFGKVDADYFRLIQEMNPLCHFSITAHNEETAREYSKRLRKYYSLKSYSIELL